ncbi:MAG: DUF1667 domain-containing protein [Treponema sp.]|nr:DUF1667 domain-containing protein [Treponema sp.]
MNLSEEKTMTCIVCPIGCELHIRKIGSGNSTSDFDVTGNNCKNGEKYAIQEETFPMRTLTTTVRVNNGTQPLVPVKSVPEIPKILQLECMEVLKRFTAQAPIKNGDILYPDILGTGANIIACESVEEKSAT